MAAEKKIKDRLLEKTAEDTKHSLSVVEDTMRWMFKDMTKAFKIHKQVEMSGFGVFLMSQAKLRRRIKTLERVMGYLKAKPPTEDVLEKLEGVNKSLQYYYSRQTNETKQKSLQTDMGGMAQLAVASGENEGGDSQNS